MASCCHLARRVRAIPLCYHYSPQYQNQGLLTPLLHSSLSTETKPPKELSFMAKYLISSFGLSPDRAQKVSASRNLVPIQSAGRPDSVVQFLKDVGLSDAQIRATISSRPILLSCSVENTLKPKVRQLMDAGFSQELLVSLIRYNSGIFQTKDTLKRILFWRDFVGKDDEIFLKIIPRNNVLFTFDLHKHILPKFNLLKEYGLSNTDILLVVKSGNRSMNKSLDTVRQTLEIIEELGIPRGSRLFLNAVKGLGGLNEDVIKKRLEFFKKTYGWSQEDVIAAFRKFPSLPSCSENKVKSNMGFLLGEAGFEPRSIASDPILIGLSLERVLIPRFAVLRALKAKGLKMKCSLSTACRISEKFFYERYVVPFEKEVPGLHQAYGLRVSI